MSDNVEEVQESTPEPQGQVETQPQEPQNLSEQPQEGGHIRPENIPENFGMLKQARLEQMSY